MIEWKEEARGNSTFTSFVADVGYFRLRVYFAESPANQSGWSVYANEEGILEGWAPTIEDAMRAAEKSALDWVENQASLLRTGGEYKESPLWRIETGEDGTVRIRVRQSYMVDVLEDFRAIIYIPKGFNDDLLAALGAQDWVKNAGAIWPDNLDVEVRIHPYTNLHRDDIKKILSIICESVMEKGEEG